VRGVAPVRQGHTTDLRLTFEASGPGTYDSHRQAEAPENDYPDSDVRLLAEGYVTVTPISAKLGESEAPAEELRRRLDATKFQ
jgi:broad specificity polyphosphatase/5'/3'-nucleotidase SurE